MSLRRLLAIVVKELRQMRRDRITLAMIVGIPVMQLVLFGYAINFTLRDLRQRVADQAGTAGSRAVVMDMQRTGVIEPAVEARSPQELMDAAAARRDQRGLSCRRTSSVAASTGAKRCRCSSTAATPSCRARRSQLAQVPLDSSRSHRPCARQHRPGAPADQRGQLLQPGAALGDQHRPGADRHHPDHDDGDVHRRRHRARTRARQHGAADRHAREQQRVDDRQGAALRRHRPGADDAGAAAGRVAVRRPRFAAACSMSTSPRCC